MNTDESVKLLARVDERTIMIQERLDDFITQSQENCARCFDDHEIRLRKVEQWQWKATGISAAVTGFCGTLAGIFVGKGGT